MCPKHGGNSRHDSKDEVSIHFPRSYFSVLHKSPGSFSRVAWVFVFWLGLLEHVAPEFEVWFVVF